MAVDALTVIQRVAAEQHVLWRKARSSPQERERMKSLRHQARQAWGDRRLERCTHSAHLEWYRVEMSVHGGLRPCEETVIWRLSTPRIQVLREMWQEVTAESNKTEQQIA